MRVAWIGLGTMGLPMARHLVAAGYDVVAYDLDPVRSVPLGAPVSSPPAEAAAYRAAFDAGLAALDYSAVYRVQGS